MIWGHPARHNQSGRARFRPRSYVQAGARLSGSKALRRRCLCRAASRGVRLCWPQGPERALTREESKSPDFSRTAGRGGGRRAGWMRCILRPSIQKCCTVWGAARKACQFLALVSRAAAIEIREGRQQLQQNVDSSSPDWFGATRARQCTTRKAPSENPQFPS